MNKIEQVEVRTEAKVEVRARAKVEKLQRAFAASFDPTPTLTYPSFGLFSKSNFTSISTCFSLLPQP
jgi:hypothetical protein